MICAQSAAEYVDPDAARAPAGKPAAAARKMLMTVEARSYIGEHLVVAPATAECCYHPGVYAPSRTLRYVRCVYAPGRRAVAGTAAGAAG